MSQDNHTSLSLFTGERRDPHTTLREYSKQLQPAGNSSLNSKRRPKSSTRACYYALLFFAVVIIQVEGTQVAEVPVGQKDISDRQRRMSGLLKQTIRRKSVLAGRFTKEMQARLQEARSRVHDVTDGLHKRGENLIAIMDTMRAKIELAGDKMKWTDDHRASPEILKRLTENREDWIDALKKGAEVSRQDLNMIDEWLANFDLKVQSRSVKTLKEVVELEKKSRFYHTIIEKLKCSIDAQCNDFSKGIYKMLDRMMKFREANQITLNREGLDKENAIDTTDLFNLRKPAEHGYETFQEYYNNHKKQFDNYSDHMVGVKDLLQQAGCHVRLEKMETDGDSDDETDGETCTDCSDAETDGDSDHKKEKLDISCCLKRPTRAFFKNVKRKLTAEELNEIKDLLRCIVVCKDAEDLRETLKNFQKIMEENGTTFLVVEKNGWSPKRWKKRLCGDYIDEKIICEHYFEGSDNKPVYSETQFTTEALHKTNHDYDQHGIYNVVRVANIPGSLFGKCLAICDAGINLIYIDETLVDNYLNHNIKLAYEKYHTLQKQIDTGAPDEFDTEIVAIISEPLYLECMLPNMRWYCLTYIRDVAKHAAEELYLLNSRIYLNKTRTQLDKIELEKDLLENMRYVIEEEHNTRWLSTEEGTTLEGQLNGLQRRVEEVEKKITSSQTLRKQKKILDKEHSKLVQKYRTIKISAGQNQEEIQIQINKCLDDLEGIDALDLSPRSLERKKRVLGELGRYLGWLE